MIAPGTPGNYYFWAIAKDAGAQRRRNVLLADSFHHAHVIDHGHSTRRTRPRHAGRARPRGALATAARRERRRWRCGGTFTGPYPNAIAGISGWWDAGTFDGLLDAGAHSAAGVEQRSRQRRRQVGQRQCARGIPRHRQHAAAGDAALEWSARRCRPQLGGPAGDAAGRLLSAADGSRSGVPPRNGQPRRRSGWTWYLVWSRPNWRQGLVRSDHAAERWRRDASCRRMACAAQATA